MATAAEQLHTYRVEHKLSLVKLSRLLDCDPSMISRLESGERTPGEDTGLRDRLFRVCGIPQPLWDAHASSEPAAAGEV